jgi:peroxiredoxin
MNVQVLGISVDHVPGLKAWGESLGGITFPLLSDFWPHGQVAEKFGVLRQEGYTERAIFIIDSQGVIRYIDIHDIDDQPDNDVLFAELANISPVAAAALKLQQQKDAAVASLPHGGVVMYCTSWCPGCRQARVWFKDHNIEYREVDIEKTPGAADQVRKWANGNRTTPTFDIDGEIVVDYKIDQLEKLLLKK